MKLLRLSTIRLGEVREIVSYLENLQLAYNNIYAFDLIVNDAKKRYSEDLGDGRWSSRSSSRVRSRIVRKIRDVSDVVIPEDRLRIRSVVVQSPGFWDFVGSLSPLETLRKYIQDRHERRKDMDYRNRLESERMVLENERLKTEVAKAQLDLLAALGFPEDRIREVAMRHIIKPLEGLDGAQDSGLIDAAEIIDIDDPTEP